MWPRIRRTLDTSKPNLVPLSLCRNRTEEVDPRASAYEAADDVVNALFHFLALSDPSRESSHPRADERFGPSRDSHFLVRSLHSFDQFESRFRQVFIEDKRNL
jgi:hypothetical protein